MHSRLPLPVHAWPPPLRPFPALLPEGPQRNALTTQMARMQNCAAVAETNQRINRSARANVRRSRANVAPSPVRSSPRKKQRAARQWGTGGRIQAIYQACKCGSRTKYPGTILHVNSNGSYAICYDDGDHEDKVLLKMKIRL